jgi:hypothetical protein
MEFLAGLIALISLIVFFVMASNLGTSVTLVRSILVSQDTTRKYVRIIAKIQAGLELTDDEKANLVESQKTKKP